MPAMRRPLLACAAGATALLRARDPLRTGGVNELRAAQAAERAEIATASSLALRAAARDARAADMEVAHDLAGLGPMLQKVDAAAAAAKADFLVTEAEAEQLVKASGAPAAAAETVRRVAGGGDPFARAAGEIFDLREGGPRERAEVAARRESAPWRVKYQALERQMFEKQQRSQHLQAQAALLFKTARAVADSATVRQAAGDVERAAAEMTQAHEMMNQAQMFQANALKMNEGARAVQLLLPPYEAAAQLRDSTVRHQVAPAEFPEAGVPASGFNPPDPPL